MTTLAVYRGYDADALYAQYNNRAMVPNYQDYADEWARRSEAVRNSGIASVLDIAYGADPAQRIDLFLPERAKPPLYVFVHGGYWQWNTRKPYAFLAERLVPAGAALATVGYPLCPSVGFRVLCDSVRAAIAHLWHAAADYGYDRERIHLAGHSAGGHLTALMVATAWPRFDGALPADLLKSAMPVSGIFDLEPIRHTPIGAPLGLDAAATRAHSPLFLPTPANLPVTVAVGGDESAEFHRQATAYRDHLSAGGLAADVLDVAGKHHFSVLAELAVADGALLTRALALLGL